MNDDLGPTEHAKVNHVAIRCFRDTGDADYLTARLAMRSALPGPFLSASQQALEKYQKCILMLNRIDTFNLSHRLEEARLRIQANLIFNIEFDREEEVFFKHLETWKFDRYLTNSLFARTEELMVLDRLVWKLRQYCRPVDMIHRSQPPDKSIVSKNLAEIKERVRGSAKEGRIPGGSLERILDNKMHPARPGLVWQNLWFTNNTRTSLKIFRGYQAENAPLFNFPEVAREASRYMQISPKLIRGAEQLAREKARKKNKV